MTDRNANRPGYQKTKVGWIPEEWELRQLSSLSRIINSNVDKKTKDDEKPVILCNYLDVYENRLITDDIVFMRATASQSEIDKYSLHKNDVIITKDSETREDIANSAMVWQSIEDLLCGYHLTIIRPKKKLVDSLFLTYLIGYGKIHGYFVSHANGATRYGLTLSTIGGTKIPLPPLHEQQKIAEILSTWDRAIEQTQKLIDAKQRLKKGLMQQLLTGERRFPGFGKLVKNRMAPENWKAVPLSSFLKEKNEKNHKNGVSLVLSCSKLYGIIAQSERFDKRIAATDVSRYKIVRKGDLVYDPMLLWDASIGFVENYEQGVVSPAYSTFSFIGDEDTYEYLNQLIYSYELRHYYKVISQGTNRRRRKAPSNAFLKTIIRLPKNKQELIRIKETLVGMDEEIRFLENKFEALRKQKQGLMQKLLTGEVRVKE